LSIVLGTTLKANWVLVLLALFVKRRLQLLVWLAQWLMLWRALAMHVQ
jgi:hypothetical protein